MSDLRFPVRVYRDDSLDSIRDKPNPHDRYFVRIPGEADATTEAGEGDVYVLIQTIEIGLTNWAEEQAMVHVLSTCAQYQSTLDDNFRVQRMFYIVMKMGLQRLRFDLEVALALPKSPGLRALITGLPDGVTILEQLLQPVYEWAKQQPA